MNGIELIAAERQRQIEVEGWTPEHDAEQDRGALIAAAVAYLNGGGQNSQPPIGWPWEASWWKPSDDRTRNLVKAGALIAAEIDRLRAVSRPERSREVTVDYDSCRDCWGSGYRWRAWEMRLGEADPWTGAPTWVSAWSEWHPGSLTWPEIETLDSPGYERDSCPNGCAEPAGGETP